MKKVNDDRQLLLPLFAQKEMLIRSDVADADTTVVVQQASILSLFFARFIAEQSGQSMDGVLARTAAWLADMQSQGDVCLDLSLYAGLPWPGKRARAPELEAWRDELLASDCVAEPGAVSPMILDGNRLYLKRFLDYECAVAQGISSRLQQAVAMDDGCLQAELKRLFPTPDDAEPDWQMLAAAQAVTRRFSVISGGPGTGKTTSLVKVLALLLQQQPQMQIRLAAPTGKAAARMVESIRGSIEKVACDAAIKELIPTEASTLHRLLGYSPRGYRHDHNNPLLIDCLVVDEASMLDLTMAARLLAALPDQCRLILLGDRDQLASVDAGNVLGDITGHGHAIAYSPQTALRLSALSGYAEASLPVSSDASAISDAVALLRTSYRFHAQSGIGHLARMVNAGQGDGAMTLLREHAYADIAWLQEVASAALLDQISAAYTDYLQFESVDEALKAFEQVRVLCAVHGGPSGIHAVNNGLARLFYGRGLIGGLDAAHGMPVMVTANHYELGLFNGDTGLLWTVDGKLCAWFRQTDGTLKGVPVQLLPEYVPAWAVSVHKSQGSEFEQVMLLLPDQEADSPLLTRELLYTAITRAKVKLSLYADELTLRRMIARRVRRSTGLAARLGWPD
ncbi:MAG: exodeoxyribonuclease V subunit alpha [Zetaproteobacteria bacterium CG23_combo_of_CG06-09_8_20_14_all_54_7]|nr:MAG: exodeoxyribonuclease V subunit alpha [Zetaproteobacteria bacterium CG23_combo_of_CG06-09_8_20_14_all_54_7]